MVTAGRGRKPDERAAEPAFRQTSPGFARIERQLCCCSGRGHELCGKVVVVQGDGGGHDVLAVADDSVAASSWDLGDESVAAEFDDEP